MRTSCTACDCERISPEETQELLAEFLPMIEAQFPDTGFGYNSLPQLQYERSVLSTIFSKLKDGGKIRGAGFMVFRLAV